MLTATTPAAPARAQLGTLERPCEIVSVAVNPECGLPVRHQLFLKLNKVIDGVLCRFHVYANTNDDSLAWQLKYESRWTAEGFQFVYGTVYRNAAADESDCF